MVVQTRQKTAAVVEVPGRMMLLELVAQEQWVHQDRGIMVGLIIPIIQPPEEEAEVQVPPVKMLLIQQPAVRAETVLSGLLPLALITRVAAAAEYIRVAALLEPVVIAAVALGASEVQKGKAAAVGRMQKVEMASLLCGILIIVIILKH
jgi:hypothetical protein